jgi:glycosyltransferase involved in cell wall biosynthesis
MKILLYGNSPLGESGYSTVTRNLAPRWKALGHDVVIFAYYGIQVGHPLDWKGIPVVPGRWDPWGRDIIEEHVKKIKPDVVIQIFDLWVAPKLPEQIRYLVAHTPIDFEGIGPLMRDLLNRCWKVVPFCKWSEEQCRKNNVKCEEFIPHGVDTKIFYPKPEERRREFLESLNPKPNKDDFIIGIVAANYDREIRKRFDKMFEGIRIFLDQNPDAKIKVYLHTDVTETQYGVDLISMNKEFGLEKITYMADPYNYVVPITHERMNDVYNSFDILLNCSMREGFGLTPLEAQACKVPAIQTDFSAMSELTLPYLRVKVQAKIMSPLIAWQAIPDANDIAEKIEYLWKSPNRLQRAREEAYQLAMKYKWDDIVKNKWKPFWEKCEAEIKEERKWLS